jgi:ABC-type transport system involved in multi-copper enzyme maturation permease subunit
VIALVRSEVRRFRSRRLVKALAIIALVGIATTVVILAVRSNPGTGDVFTLGDARPFLEGTASLFAIAGWLIGTSLVGAEWQAGTMSTLLTWDPRRSRVLVAKTIAAAIGVFALVFVLDLLFTGLMALVATTRGSTDGTDASLVRSLVGFDLRVATLAALGAILGLSLGTLGIAFVYLVIVEGIFRQFLPGWRAWLLGDNSTIFLLAQTDGEIGRSMLSAALVVVLWCVAWLSVAMGTFLARDVD